MAFFSLSPVRGAELYTARDCESDALWEPKLTSRIAVRHTMRVFPNSYTLYLCVSVSSLPISSSQLIPPSLRSLFLQSGWERALTTSSFITQRLNPLLFGQKKRGAALFFFCSSVLPVLLTGSPRWMQPAELIAPCYWRSASLCDTHAVQPYGCPLGEEFD